VTSSVLAFIPSPAQGVWHLGPLPLRAYALCIIVGIVAALIIGDRRWVARGGEQGVIYDIALWAVPFGLIGGRLYHLITDWKTYFGPDGAGLGAAIRIWDGGLGIWGAVALGGVGAWIGCRQRGIPLPAFGDAIAPGIILAQAIGRLGNYFNQELYGRATDLPWGLEIYERRDHTGALDSLNGVSTGQLVDVVHPTFLYELLWNVLIFALLIWADRRFNLGHGRLFALYVAGYCVGRFWVELMRSDAATHIAGIRINTFTSTFVFIAAVVYIMAAPKGREDPATLKGNDDDASPLDELGEELTAVAATSGLVAAAKVAGQEDEREPEPDAAESSEAEAMSPDTEVVESEAAAEAEDLVEQVESASSEEIAEAEAFAEAGAEPEAGLGSVDGDEVLEAEVVAPEVHEAAVERAEEAEAVAEGVAEDVAEEPETVGEGDEESELDDGDESDDEDNEDVEGAEPVSAGSGPMSEQAEELAAEPDDELEDESAEAESVEAAAEAIESDASEPDEDEDEPEEGLGSVEGDEVAAAEEDAPEVQAAAVEGADVAEALAADVADEPASEPMAEPARKRWWRRRG
jgi:prolipoprotein diacylglyceryl transferase